MRIEELYLEAFGPFEEKVLRFPSPEPGLVIVYGPNEAGKSSALRAIQNLLYGIPEKTKDHFHRKPKEMRVGGRLRFLDGESVAFTRRKGRKDTLLSYHAPTIDAPTDAPTEAGAPSALKSGRRKSASDEKIVVPRLEALVAAIPESLFASFYGLDHRELSRGARVLLEDEGELGRALFAAGMGTANLRRLLDRLDEEASELFKPRGQNQPLAQSIGAYEKLRREIREQSLRPEDFEKAREDLENLETRLAQLEAEIESTRAERTRLDRIRRTLSDLGRYRVAIERFEPLEALRPLPSDFGARLREAQQRRANAKERQIRADDQIAVDERRREEQARVVGQAPELARSSEEIHSLVERVGGYREAIEQLPRRRAELDRLQGEIETLLASLGVSEQAPEIATLDVTLAHADRIRELTSQRTEGAVRIETAQAECKAARSALEQVRKRLQDSGSPVDTTGLARVVERARKLGDLDQQISAEGPELEAREEEDQRGLARLGFWTGSIDEIDRRVFPDPEAIDAFADRFERVARAGEDLERDRVENENDRREALEGLAQLRGEGAVPSEGERDAARQKRNESWRRLRSERGQPLDALDADLPDQFESEMARADEVSDRLRQEAERVERAAQFEARLVRVAAAAEDQVARQARIEQEQERVQQSWRSLWQPLSIEPGTPAEMRTFTDRRRRLFDEIRATRSLRQKWLARNAERAQACKSIAHELGELDRLARSREDKGRESSAGFERLDDAIAAAERRLATYREVEQTVAQLRAEQESAAERNDKAQERLRTLEAGGASQEREWERAVGGLGLGASPAAREVEARLTSLEALAQRRRERDQLAERVAKMQANLDAFAADVESVLARCAPDLVGSEPGTAVPQLRSRLTEAEKQETLTREIDASLETRREDRAAALREYKAAAEVIRSLQEEAGAADESELEPAIDNARLRAEAQRNLQEVKSRLLEVGEGKSISAIEIEAKEVDGDALPGRIERLDEEIKQKMAAAKVLHEESFKARQTVEAMDGSAKVAELAAEAEDELASIARNAKRYVTLRIARLILAQEIETYREENQTPVLGRASRIFQRLTLGEYVGVQSAIDDADRTELIAVTRRDEKKTVDQLSAGTRDQLFLALRLATLEAQVERAEPMPLVADDILVEFDDARSRATLEVLAELANKTQILLFSHHRHVLDQARELGGRVSIVEL